MVEIHCVQTFDVSPEAVWDVFFDPEYEERLEALDGVSREITSDETRDGVRHFVQRVVTDRKVPAAFRKVAGMDFVSYDQISALDLASGVMTWTVDMAAASDRAAIGGTTQIVPTPTGCERTVQGSIVIRVPLLGAKIEKALAKGVQEAQDRAGELLQAMLAER